MAEQPPQRSNTICAVRLWIQGSVVLETMDSPGRGGRAVGTNAGAGAAQRSRGDREQS